MSDESTPQQAPATDDTLDARLSVVEDALKKAKTVSTISLVASIVLGTGGLFSVIQWLVKGPQLDKQYTQAQIDKTQVDARLNQISAESAAFDLQSKRFSADSDKARRDLAGLDAKLQLQARLHQEAIQSLTREKELATSLNDRAAIKALVTQLIEREEAWRRLLGKLPPELTRSANGLGDAAEEAAQQSELFEERARQILASIQGSPGTHTTDSPIATPKSKQPPIASTGLEAAIEEPLIGESGRHLLIPPNYYVKLTVEGPKDLVLETFAYLPLKASLVANINRVSYKDKRIYIRLGAGESASFTTPDDISCALEFDSGRVNAPDLSEFDRIEPGILGPVRDERGKLKAVIYSGLPKGFKIVISWHSLEQ